MLLDEIIAKLDEDRKDPVEVPEQGDKTTPDEPKPGYLAYGQDFLEKYPRKAPAPHL